MLLKLCLLIVLTILSGIVEHIGDSLPVLVLKIGIYVGMFSIIVNLMMGFDKYSEVENGEADNKK